jgi:hypothetical protein
VLDLLITSAKADSRHCVLCFWIFR